MPRRSLLLGAALALAVLAATAALATTLLQDGRIGPDRKVLNTGQRLEPFGKRTGLGNFPTGGAVTPNGRYYWTVSTGRGLHDVRIVSIRTGRLLQTLRIPGGSGGIVMDPKESRVYVSGVNGSSYTLQKPAAGAKGADGDVIHVFTYNPKTGGAKEDKVLDVPPPSDAPAPQNFPPTNVGQRLGWPDRLAISNDGKRLLVPQNLADSAAIVDISSGAVRTLATGSYPYGAAITPDGKTGLVTNEAAGTVSFIDMDDASEIAEVAVGPKLSHPEGIVVDADGKRAYVAVAESDQVAVLDVPGKKVLATISVGREEGLGTSPVDLALAPDGRRLYVVEAGADEIAVIGLPGAGSRAARSRARAAGEQVLAHEVARAAARTTVAEEEEEEGEDEGPAIRASTPDYPLLGRIPTSDYPADVEIVRATNPCGFRAAKAKRRTKKARRCAKIVYTTGKGLGTGPNPDGPRPDSPDDSDGLINRTAYLPLINLGEAGIGDVPSDARLARYTRAAGRQIRPSDAQSAPADTPLRAGGPIEHVFYLVRENRTYDQILGDVAKGDGDPKLAIFGGKITPNAHALGERFPLLDHVYANSEASIDGHFWTSAARVSDYVNKNWFQNYGGRKRPYDFGVYSVTWPASGFLFDQAEKQGISYFNYGEAIAGTIPLADKDRDADATAKVAAKFAKSDLGVGAGCYGNDASVGEDVITGLEVYDGPVPAGAKTGATSRIECFTQRFQAQLATNSVPAFNYLVMTNDHTQTLSAGKRTPRAMVADNDIGLGQLVDVISHSSIWSKSAIFVIEDDSQDGADHVDAHRIPAFVISPHAKRGAVVHRRYDFLSVIRSMELILGMKPLGLFDALAVPMYDAFSGKPDNAEPYSVQPTTIDLVERNPAGTAGARESARLPKCLDCSSQRDIDRLLWKSIHGAGAAPPPPGPNASRQDAERLEHDGG